MQKWKSEKVKKWQMTNEQWSLPFPETARSPHRLHQGWRFLTRSRRWFPRWRSTLGILCVGSQGLPILRTRVVFPWWNISSWCRGRRSTGRLEGCGRVSIGGGWWVQMNISSTHWVQDKQDETEWTWLKRVNRMHRLHRIVHCTWLYIAHDCTLHTIAHACTYHCGRVARRCSGRSPRGLAIGRDRVFSNWNGRSLRICWSGPWKPMI